MNKDSWPTFKAGDRVWCAVTGKWVTLQGNPGSNVVFAGVWSYNEYGCFHGMDGLPLLFRNEVKPEDWPQQAAPLPDLPVDAPIMVRQKIRWHKRHFARWENGRAVCWADGLTSFTAKIATCWDEWRLPTQEELSQCSNK